MRGGRGKGAPRGWSAAAPGGAQTLERVCGPPRPSAPGVPGSWRRRSGAAGPRGGGGSAAAGRPWPGAGRRRHPQPAPFLPPSARPHLPSLAFLSPSALLAGRKDVLLPFPCGRSARPLPGLRFPPRLRPGPWGAWDAGPALGALGSLWRLQGLASCPQRWPPSPNGGKKLASL